MMKLIINMSFLFISSLGFSQSLDTSSLKSNGVGMRLATFFNIEVYKAELFLEKKSSSVTEILALPGRKVVTMVFSRGLSKSRLVGGFQTGMKNNELRDAFGSFYNSVKAVKEGDRMVFSFEKDSMRYQFNNEKPLSLNLPNASEYLKLWIGVVPNSELKTGLLGLE